MTNTRIRNEQITSESETDGYVLTAGGTGTAEWEAQASGAGGALLIYDDSSFIVTGTAISFDNNLDVASTGTTAYINYGDIGVKIYRSTSQTIVHGTGTVLNFDSEDWDTDGMHSGSSSQIYCNTAGKYLLIFHGGWLTAPTDAQFSFYINGTTFLGYVRSIELAITMSSIADLNIGDYVEVIITQTTGGSSRDIRFLSGRSPYFIAQKIA